MSNNLFVLCLLSTTKGWNVCTKRYLHKRVPFKQQGLSLLFRRLVIQTDNCQTLHQTEHETGPDKSHEQRLHNPNSIEISVKKHRKNKRKRKLIVLGLLKFLYIVIRWKIKCNLFVIFGWFRFVYASFTHYHGGQKCLEKYRQILKMTLVYNIALHILFFKVNTSRRT